MRFQQYCLTLCLALSTCVVGAISSPRDSSPRIQRVSRESTENTYQEIRRGLALAKLEKREDFKGNQTLDRSWNGATLLKIEAEGGVPQKNPDAEVTVAAGIEITCTTCYVKGLAVAELSISDDFNASAALQTTIDSVKDNVSNFTETFEDYLANYTEGVIEKFSDGIDLADFEFPTFPYAFDLEVPSIPECTLKFQFDGLELYMELNTVLALETTYELNLYSSNSPIGIKVGPNLLLGVVASIDLILGVDGEIDISSGFHIQLDDGAEIDIALFGNEVGNIEFNGGKFEFLPVTIQSAGVTLSAVLRIGIHAGLEVAAPTTNKLEVLAEKIGLPQVSGGVEVAVYANVAEFITNVTLVPDDEECELKVVQEYNLALGAIAGASVAVGPFSWGPVAETSIPIWTTTLAEACGIKGTPKPTPTASLTAAGEKRQDLKTTVVSTTITTSGVSCTQTGVANCPVSAQVTSKVTIVKSLTTSVPSDVEATYPQETFDSVSTTIPFGKNVQSITATTGSPTSFTAPPTPTGDDADAAEDDKGNVLEGKTGGVSNKVIIGVSVGVGVPVLAAIIGAIIFLQKRRRYNAVPKSDTHAMSQPYGYTDHAKPKKTPGIYVSEVR